MNTAPHRQPAPPGHYLTQEHLGVSWRYAHPLHHLDDELIALTVTRFNHEDFGTEPPENVARNRRNRRLNNGAVTGSYQVAGHHIAIIKVPVDQYPTVYLP